MKEPLKELPNDRRQNDRPKIRRIQERSTFDEPFRKSDDPDRRGDDGSNDPAKKDDEEIDKPWARRLKDRVLDIIRWLTSFRDNMVEV